MTSSPVSIHRQLSSPQRSFKRQVSFGSSKRPSLQAATSPIAEGIYSSVKMRFIKQLELAGRGNETELVQLGDIVFLGMIDSGGDLRTVVDADGFFTDLVYPLTPDKEDARVLSQCLFRVVPALHYDAQKELVERTQEDDATKETDNDQHFALVKLKARHAENEIMKNAAKLRKIYEADVSHTELAYGDEVQLQHLPTGKFLTASAELTLRLTKGNQVRRGMNH